METIESIILSRGSRGMDCLRTHLPENFCHRAAETILRAERGTVILTTGFYVAGHAETDGPAGTYALAETLRTLGFTPVILTDEPCRGYFEPVGLETEYMGYTDGKAFCEQLLARWNPTLLVSVERCGRNTEGKHANMRGVSVDAHTAPTELLFELTAGRIPSVGVGDGGNEIGMGCFKEVIAAELSLVPCEIPVSSPVIATVSNWGAYGIAACLQELTGQVLMPTPEKLEAFVRSTLALGSVEGISGKNEPAVDGFPLETELGVYKTLYKQIL